MRRVAIIAAAILIGSFALNAPGYSLGLGDLLSKVEGDQGFKTIHVSDLASMMAKPGSKVMVFDANPPDLRDSEGIIPGSHLLASSSHYDVASELPPGKDTPLVFYCHNWL